MNAWFGTQRRRLSKRNGSLRPLPIENAGLRVASIARPDVFGPRTAASDPKESADVVAQNLIELAAKLSAGRG